MHHGAYQEGKAAAVVIGSGAKNPYSGPHKPHDAGCVLCECASDWQSGYQKTLAESGAAAIAEEHRDPECI